jgi:hypothetical protein
MATMKKAEIEEKLVFARAAAAAALQNMDFEKIITLKAEMHALNILLQPKLPKLQSEAKKRGRNPDIFNRIVQRMKNDLLNGVNLRNLKQDNLAELYGACRETCCKARDAVLAEFAGK